jgi:hypothetical protein
MPNPVRINNLVNLQAPQHATRFAQGPPPKLDARALRELQNAMETNHELIESCWHEHFA